MLAQIAQPLIKELNLTQLMLQLDSFLNRAILFLRRLEGIIETSLIIFLLVWKSSVIQEKYFSFIYGEGLQHGEAQQLVGTQPLVQCLSLFTAFLGVDMPHLLVISISISHYLFAARICNISVAHTLLPHCIHKLVPHH